MPCLEPVLMMADEFSWCNMACVDWRFERLDAVRFGEEGKCVRARRCVGR